MRLVMKCRRDSLSEMAERFANNLDAMVYNIGASLW